MSKLYDMRRTLADRIIAADIGWVEEAIVLKRQTDLFNDIATAMACTKHGGALHIGVASGDSTDDDSLAMDVNLTLTIVCPPELTEGATPEEDLWEDLVEYVHGLTLNVRDHYQYRFRFKSFGDVDVVIDGTPFLGRQTVFTKALVLKSQH